MALVIRDVGGVPDEKWHYPVQATGHDIYAPNWPTLYSEIQQHCASNNIPVPSLQDVIDWCCQNLHIPCYDDQSRQPLVNKFTMGIPHKPTASCCNRSK